MVTLLNTWRNPITPELRSKWCQQLLEAIVFIHSHGIIHSDLALRQFFIDENFDLRVAISILRSVLAT